MGIKSLRLREEHAAHGTITKQFLLLCTFVHIHIWRHEQNKNVVSTRLKHVQEGNGHEIKKGPQYCEKKKKKKVLFSERETHHLRR